MRDLSFDASGRRRRQTTSHLSSSSHTITHKHTEHASEGWGKRRGRMGEPRRERCGGVCYRYRATWPRGDRDNASPPLLSARRFACFGYPYLRTVPTYLRSYSSTPPTPFRPTDSYFRATWRRSPFERLHGKREIDNDIKEREKDRDNIILQYGTIIILYTPLS